MNIAYFTQLYAYDDWANRRALETLRAVPTDLPRPRKLLAHICAAKEVWMARLRNRNPGNILIFPERSLDQCAQDIKRMSGAYSEFLSGLADADLERELEYRNLKGDPFSTPIGEILTHVGAHGAYHRGQIATLVRDSGHDPLGTDFILFTRL